MKNKKIEILLVAVVIIFQTIIFTIAGINKSYIHMDEAYSLGLASYERVEIQDNEDFYNTWHNNEYYEDYLAVNDDEKEEYSQVYENQKNDVHPPLYYLLLRIAMGFSSNHFSKWPGIILNMIIFAFITIFMYLILKKVLGKQEQSEKKALILAFVSSVTMASITNAIYIRMYALSVLNILIIAFLHLKLIDKEKTSAKLLVLIGVAALVGSLTHYYYLFYLACLFILIAIKYIKEKRYKEFALYTLTMCIAAGVSLLIFPYSIQHLFFGYRGQGALSKIADIQNFLTEIGQYFLKMDKFAFNGLMFVFIAIIIASIIYRKIRKKEDVKGKAKENAKTEKNKYMKYIVFPTTIYFILVAISSPWVELRYIMPITGLVFVIISYYMYMELNKVLKEKVGNIVMALLLTIVLIAPIFLKIEPEVMYSDKKEIVEQLSGELNLPTIFFFNSNNNRFLDDILLFSKIDKSYVAKDIDIEESKIKEILEGATTESQELEKDDNEGNENVEGISKGIVVFINEGQENDEILEITKKAANLQEVTYLKRLNACDVYSIK